MVRPSPLLVVATLTLAAWGAGCGGPKVVHSSMSARAFASQMEGVWQDDDGARYTFARVKHDVVVTSVVDADGEVFDVTDPGQMLDAGFTWVYRVPSTEYVVAHTIVGVSDGQFEARWDNEQETGMSTFTRP